MRRLVITELVSLDGVFEDAGGGEGFQHGDDPGPRVGREACGGCAVGGMSSVAETPPLPGWTAGGALPTRPTLHGREEESGAVARVVAGARDGRGGVLALSGAAGVGKSALLAHAAARAGRMRLLDGTGTELEATLPYAALRRLLGPLFEDGVDLPDPQARALAGALGGEDADPDRFLVCLAALALLGEAAADRGLVCLVDDAHWLDPASAGVLSFVARRAHVAPLALLLAGRDGGPGELSMAGVPELRLGGLEAQAASALLREHAGGEVAADVRDRLLASTHGNPLALAEAARTLRPAQLTGEADLPDPLPWTVALERAFLEPLRRFAPDARAALLLVAAEGTGDLAAVRAAAGRLGLDGSALERGGMPGALSVGERTVAFEHPFVASAVYMTASPAARRLAHRALAAVLDDEEQADRRAWHRATGVPGPSEDVAEALERSAERARRRSGLPAAARALERAAELSATADRRARRLVTAADLAVQGGDPRRARLLTGRARQLAPRAPDVDLEIAHVRATLELRDGMPANGVAILREALDGAPAAGRRGVLAVSALAEAAACAGEPGVFAESARRAAELGDVLDPGDAAILALLGAVAATVAGRPVAAPDVHAALAPAHALDDSTLLVRAGAAASRLGEGGAAAALIARGVVQARSQGARATLAWALDALALSELRRGLYPSAAAHAQEGRRLALETGGANVACAHASRLALLAAHRGQADDCRRWTSDALAGATGRHLAPAAAAARLALGTLELGRGRPAPALGHLEAATAGGAPVALDAASSLVEAAVRADRPERGRAALAELAHGWAAVSAPGPRAVEACCRAMLASGDVAERHFTEALRLHAHVVLPFERARTELLFGEALSRERRRIPAREHLRAALDGFEALGAEPWARRARAELRSAGAAVRRDRASTLDALTPQERRIVDLVREGRTNRQTGAEMFLSPRTVDYHLRNVFRKLGIRSRAELVAGGG